ncbi:MAG: hypothetical protein PSN37_04470 [Alphaproteobacteria bacterium]|nr:hypothetical protein [Alphaproteobacteria bacterium]
MTEEKEQNPQQENVIGGKKENQKREKEATNTEPTSKKNREPRPLNRRLISYITSIVLGIAIILAWKKLNLPAQIAETFKIARQGDGNKTLRPEKDLLAEKKDNQLWKEITKKIRHLEEKNREIEKNILNGPALLLQIKMLRNEARVLRSNIRKLREKLNKPPSAPSTSFLSSEIEALQKKLTALQNDIRKIKNEKNKQQTQTSFPLPLIVTQTKIFEEKIRKLQNEIRDIRNKKKRSSKDRKNLLLMLALINLERTLHEGRPYEKELKVIRQISTDTDIPPALTRHAKMGIRRQEDLARRFAALAFTIIEEERKPRNLGQATFLETLFEKARGIVRIRSIVPNGKNNTASVVARIEVALKENDLPEALRQTRTLKNGPLRIATPWMNQVAARRNAEASVQDLQNRIFIKIKEDADLIEQ